MNDSTAQLRVTLPTKLQDSLQAKADAFGLSMSAYVKNLILTDIKENYIPTFQASPQVEKSYKRALKERKQAVQIDSMVDFLDSL